MPNQIRIIRKSLKGAIEKTRNGLFSRYARVSFAQECEDLLLMHQFPKKKRGFYVDVGALHPIRFSNTFAFYRKGWTGLVIEPNPEAIRQFGKVRKKDIFVEEGVAGSEGKLNYYRFTEPAFNTFDPQAAKLAEAEGRPVKDILERKTSPLRDILKRSLPNNAKIDFMSIDVEGMDLEALKSNDWERFAPAWVIAEIAREDDSPIADIINNPLARYISTLQYEAIIKTGRSVIFKKCY